MRHTQQALLAAFAATLLVSTSARADTVVQIPIDSIANARPVSTVSGGMVTIWSPGQGVDGGDGFVTVSVMSLFVAKYPTYFNAGNPQGGALPDDGTFAANTDHPLVVLHFSNTAPTTAPQTFQMLATGMYPVAVPQATYSNLYLFMTSSGGGQPGMTVTFKYADATMATVAVPLNDYDVALTASTAVATFFNLAPGMHKWGGASAMYPYGNPGDNPFHEVTGVKLTPSPTKELTGFVINKTNGNQMMLWGATGVATSPVDAGAVATSGAAGDASTGSSSGASTGAAATGASSGAGAGTNSGASTGAGSGGASSGAVSTSGGGSGVAASSGAASAGSVATTGTGSGAIASAGNPTSGSAAGTGGSGVTAATSGAGATSGSGSAAGAAVTPAGGGAGGGCSVSSDATTSASLAPWALGLVLGALAGRRRRASE